MIPFLRNPYRTSGAAAVPTLSSAVVTVLGLRVTRGQILRVSGLLALRSLAGLIDIPLDDGVQAYLWGFLFSSAQAGVAVATAASLFNLGPASGIVSSLLTRFVPASLDGPFVKFYGLLVLAAGPLAAAAETVVVVYELMRAARNAEHAMYVSEASGGTLIRPAFLSAGLAALSATAAVAYACAQLCMSWVVGAAPVAVVAAVLFATAVLNDAANVVESSFIALYAALLWVAALAEEASVGPRLIPALSRPGVPDWARADDTRAALLVMSVVLLLATVGRVERLARVFAIGLDAVEEQERQDVAASQQHNQPQQQHQSQQSQPQSQEADANKGAFTVRRRPGQSKMRPVISAVTLIAATFRVLLWAGQIDPGEYVPVACRGWQLFTCVVLYMCFASIA